MRLNFELSEERMNDLKSLAAKTELATMKDLVNNALTIFEWAVSEVEAGNEIAAVNDQKEIYRVLITPALQTITKRKKGVAVGKS